MADWTPDEVEARLKEAADVLDRLPDRNVQGYFNLWPEIVHDFADRVGQKPEPMRRPPPPAAAISRMEEALAWIRLLALEDGKLVWARAEGTPWKAICWRFGIARSTADRRWRYGLGVIAIRLNGRRVATRRSRSFVIQRSKAVSRPNR